MEIISIDNPLTRLARECDEKLAEKDRQIEDLMRVVEDMRTKLNLVRGINDILKVQAADLVDTVRSMRLQLQHAEENLTTLLSKLPDIA